MGKIVHFQYFRILHSDFGVIIFLKIAPVFESRDFNFSGQYMSTFYEDMEFQMIRLYSLVMIEALLQAEHEKHESQRDDKRHRFSPLEHDLGR